MSHLLRAGDIISYSTTLKSLTPLIYSVHKMHNVPCIVPLDELQNVWDITIHLLHLPLKRLEFVIADG